MTSKEVCLMMCREGWTSPLSFMQEDGSIAFGQRIHDLKKEGYEFEERMQYRDGKYRNTHWKEFRIKRKEVQGELL